MNRDYHEDPLQWLNISHQWSPSPIGATSSIQEYRVLCNNSFINLLSYGLSINQRHDGSSTILSEYWVANHIYYSVTRRA